MRSARPTRRWRHGRRGRHPGCARHRDGHGLVRRSPSSGKSRRAEGSDLADGVTGAIVDQVAVQAPSQARASRASCSSPPTPHEWRGSPRSPARRRLGRARRSRCGRGLPQPQGGSRAARRAGDRVLVFAAGVPDEMRVRDVVEFDGAGTADAALLVPLAQARSSSATRARSAPSSSRIGVTRRRRRAVGRGGRAASSRSRTVARPRGGDGEGGRARGRGRGGRAFVAFFTTFGTFAIAAGVLLIFLVFVMLAAERRGELGIARAVGTRRGHLVQMFTFEGAAYDLTRRCRRSAVRSGSRVRHGLRHG